MWYPRWDARGVTGSNGYHLSQCDDFGGVVNEFALQAIEVGSVFRVALEPEIGVGEPMADSAWVLVEDFGEVADTEEINKCVDVYVAPIIDINKCGSVYVAPITRQ